MRLTREPSSTSSLRIRLRRVHLLEQRGVLERVGRHLSQPADEVQVFGEVARLVVGQLHHAEHVPVRHQRHRQLRLVAPLLQRVSAFSGEDGVVQRPGDDDLSGLDGAPAAGVAAQGQDDPVPLRVEPPAVVADEAAQGVALDGVDVGDGRMGEVGQALDHGVQDLVGAEAGGVLEARLHHEREVPVPPLQAGDDVAAAEGDGEQVGGHLGDVRRGREAVRRGRAELEDADEAVPEHDGGQDGAVKTALASGSGRRRPASAVARRRPRRPRVRGRRPPAAAGG